MTTTTTTPTAEEFAERVISSMVGTLDTWAIYVGDKLGLYEAISDVDRISQCELAASTGIDERYAREWLEHQVTAGVLTVDNATLPPADRRYAIPDAQSEVLTNPDSLVFLSPFVRMLVAAGLQLPNHLEAYRTGGGVSWEEFGPDMRTGQAQTNRPWFMNELGSTWFPAVPDLHRALTQGGQVADIGCGEGWSSIAIACAYPTATVVGFDNDAPSIEAARNHAADAGVADRVTFHLLDAAHADDATRYDVVTAFECIHDMPDPVAVLRRMRDMVADDGVVFVMDEAVGDAFGERDDEIERLLYGMSLFVCLPDSMSHEASVGTGTMMRPATLASYTLQAGFASVEVLPIDNDLWRFYRLRA